MGLSIYDDTLIMIYFSFLTAFFGAVMGSFLHCVAWRIVSGESIAKGRSHCPQCGHVLGILDLIPIVSWLFLGGKCRYCKKKIPARYFISEVFMAAMALLCLFRFDLSLDFILYFIFLSCLFTLSLVDLDIYKIPNECLLIPLAAWLITAPFRGVSMQEFISHVLAGLVFGGGLLGISLLFDQILKKESLGGGDIKLFGLVGLYLGWITSLFTLFLSCIFGLIFALVLAKKEKGQEGMGMKIPFGPSIAIATWIMLLYGHYFVTWYLRFLGM